MALDFVTSRDYVQLKDLDIQNTSFSKSQLYKFHLRQISNGQTNENHTKEIIDILNGIDAIKSQYTPKNTVDTKYSDLHEQVLLFKFNSKNTVLHHMIAKERADVIIRHIYNKYIILAMLFLYLIMNLWWLIFNKAYIHDGYFIFQGIFYSLLIPYQILLLLSVNIDVLKMGLSSFFLWFEFYLIIKYSILFLLLYYYYKVQAYDNHMFGNIIYCIQVALWIIISCLVDGFKIQRKYLVMGLLTATISFCSILYFDWKADYTERPKIIVGVFSYDVVSGLISADRILLIFFMKYTFSLAVHSYKCINIRVFPHYQVIDKQRENLNIDDVLSFYLSPNNEQRLTEFQLVEIGKILHLNEHQNASATVTFMSDNVITSYAHSIRKIIYHPVMAVITVIVVILDWILILAFTGRKNYEHSNIKRWFAVYYFIMICAVLVSLNWKAVKLTMSSFEFWYKMYLGIRDIICWEFLLFYFKIGGTRTGDNWLTQLGFVNLFLLVFIFSAVDGVIASRKVKIIFSVAITSYIIVCAVLNIWNTPKEDDTIIDIFGVYSTSFYYEMLNAEYTLCLFMVKQTMALILTKNKCVNIVVRPFVKWEN